MFEKRKENEPHTYRCPTCGYEVYKRFEPRDEYSCAGCGNTFLVLMDPSSGRAAFLAPPVGMVPQPLGLPRGSIRAMIAIGLTVACCGLVVLNRPVPQVLLSLLLTVVGFYFGFRTRTDSSRDRIYDATVHATQPLFLPPGLIRAVLVVAFAIAAITLYSRGQLGELEFLEFFVILFGLIVGYIFAKVFRQIENSSLHVWVNHITGLVVLLATVSVIVLCLHPAWRDSSQLHQVILCTVISFYFGSRS